MVGVTQFGIRGNARPVCIRTTRPIGRLLRLSAHHEHQEDQGHEADALKRVRGGLSITSRYAVFGRTLGGYLNTVTSRGHLDALGTG